MEEEVVTELLKGMQLLLSIKNAEEEVVVEEKDLEDSSNLRRRKGSWWESPRPLSINGDAIPTAG